MAQVWFQVSFLCVRAVDKSLIPLVTLLPASWGVIWIKDLMPVKKCLSALRNKGAVWASC